MKAFDVYLRGKCIDTVFYGDDSRVDVDEVMRSLINHDGYNAAIVVKLRREKRAVTAAKAPQYRCTYCHETKPGRWVRRGGSGWSQHMTQAVWVCHECYPTLTHTRKAQDPTTKEG